MDRKSWVLSPETPVRGQPNYLEQRLMGMTVWRLLTSQMGQHADCRGLLKVQKGGRAHCKVLYSVGVWRGLACIFEVNTAVDSLLPRSGLCRETENEAEKQRHLLTQSFLPIPEVPWVVRTKPSFQPGNDRASCET